MPKRPRTAALMLATACLALPLGAAIGQTGRDAREAELARVLAVWQRVSANYVDKTDDKAIADGAIKGMLESLDPHSSYLQASDFANLRLTTDGNYGGLGLSVQAEDGAVKVMTPTEDTPAARAGIKSGDFITHVDGQLMFGSTLDEAVAKMRGAPGSKVTITLVRPGRDKPFDVPLVRETIVLRPVKWEVKDRIGVLNINAFNAQTADQLGEAMLAVDKAVAASSNGGRPLGYVIDLRSNPGGLLDQAIRVTDAFLDNGEIVSERGRDTGDIERFFATQGDLAHGLPIVVLVDAGSASAAEIVAGALQDHGRAVVMGETSFGKGSVQTLVELGPETALRLTTARYFTPSGRSVQAGGIKPDIPVPQLSDPDYKTRLRFREADLRRHLLAEKEIKAEVLEDDPTPDPRFAATAVDLEKQGIKDYQLHYALGTLKRLATSPTAGARASR